MCHNLIASRFLFVWACELVSGIFLFLLPSCLAAASSLAFSQWPTPYAVRGHLATSHAALLRLLVGSLRCAVAVFLAGHPFLHCLLEHSFHSVGFFLVYYLDFMYIAFLRFLGFPSLTTHCSPLVVVCSSHLALLLQVSPSYTACACHRLHMRSLFRLPASFGDTVLFSCPLLFFMRFLFPEWTFAPFLTLSLSLVSLGASLPGVLPVYCVCLRSAWGPSSSFKDSSFLLVIIMFPFL